jgi:hypothetical protein
MEIGGKIDQIFIRPFLTAVLVRSVRESVFSFSMILYLWVSTVFGLMHSRLAISLTLSPSAMKIREGLELLSGIKE